MILDVIFVGIISPSFILTASASTPSDGSSASNRNRWILGLMATPLLLDGVDNSGGDGGGDGGNITAHRFDRKRNIIQQNENL